MCRRFTVFALRYGLIPKDNLIVPIAGVNQDVTTIMQQQTNSPLKNAAGNVAATKNGDSPPSPSSIVLPTSVDSDA